MSTPRRNIDIAIIGLSCRFPGAASADEYWKNLCGGVESITFFSEQELLAAGADPSLVANPNYIKAAPILRDVDMFDASFFGYSPKDAALMDPQQRLFLEVCWEAFENAGYDPTDYPGKVGVVSTAGGLVSSYLVAKMHHADFPGQTASTAHINNDKDFLSTRISFKLNLKGASYTIQSACSSSLVAVHQACQNLRFGECDAMLAGGSAVRVPQVEGYIAEKRNLYSLDGHCRPFDAGGQGTIFGSGVGAVLLKPLESALADGDNIFAVIKGTAINNDGSAKISYTAPSLGQQSQAVADALAFAGVSADSVGYVECHSTGTAIGDPIEIEALTAAFQKDTKRTQYCAVGSMKGNIGHPEQASGIAGLIKTALVLHHKLIPPSINYDTPNARIDFSSSPFFVNTGLREFPLADTPRRAGLNSLGIGGTNAFAVLEEPPSPAEEGQSSDSLPRLITLSAKDAGALVARVEQLLTWLNDNPRVRLGDLCYTTNVSRSQFAFRFAARARSVAELKNDLTAWLRNARDRALAPQRTRSAPIAFMFSGQGSQHAGMAAELYRTHSAFRNAMDRCQALARPHLEQDLLHVIFASSSEDALVNRTDYTQPALFTVGYALAELLKAWGIAPNAVIGHSLGEITGACVAGAISLEHAMRLVTARGSLMHRMQSGGAMASIWADESVVRGLIEKFAPSLTIGALNGPLSTVVSGDREPLKVLLEELARQNIVYQELRVSNAFHSSRSEPILDEFENVAGQLKHNVPRVPFISNLTGQPMADAPDKTYWRRQLREAVRFGDGMSALSKFECRTFLEIGAHPVLLPLARACLGANGKSAAWIASLDRQKSDADSINEMLIALYLAGHKVNWPAVHADAKWRRIPLPTYPFQRQRHWIEDAAHSHQSHTTLESLHPLVGARTDRSSKELCYEASYGTGGTSYFSDHRVLGAVILPTTAELEAATVLGRMHFGTRWVSFDNVMHHQAMAFSGSEDRIARLIVTPLKSDRAGFRLLSAARRDAEVWHTHMTGTLRKSEAQSEPVFSLREVRARCRGSMSAADLYARLSNLGLDYGPSFRGVRELHIGEGEALAKVRLPPHLTTAQYLLHPALLDACLHAYPIVLRGADKAECPSRSPYLPVSLIGFRCYRDVVDEAWAHIKLRSAENGGTQVVDVHVYDVAERLVAELEGLSLRRLSLETVLAPRTSIDQLFYRVAWRKSVKEPAHNKDRVPTSWIIFADLKGVGEALASRLEASGHHCHLVYADETFAQQGPRRWAVNERQPEDFRRLLTEFAAAEALPCAGVLYFWGLDAPSMEGLTLAELKGGSERMCRGALGILHALAETRSKNPIGRRLWFITANTQEIEDRARRVDPVQAPLWGLGRTIAIEHPAIWGGLIDLPLNGDSAPHIDLLAAEFLDPDGENQIVISADRQRTVPRFVRQSLAQLPEHVPPVRSDATYLVTGGLGMLGRSVAKWLIANGAKHLVLTGRNASAEAAAQVFSAAELNAAQFHILAVDISREEDVRRLFQMIKELPPLKGVVHSSGILDDGILAKLDWERFARLFDAKVYGSWLLHEHTKSLELDFFVLKSSLLSLLGSAGQANYTASNAFLDSLAAHRRGAELPAAAINWCAWSEGGLATLSGTRGEAMWSSLGQRFIAPNLAMTVFDKLMHHDVDQIAIADADWSTYAAKIGHPLFMVELVSRNKASTRRNFAQQKSVAENSIDEEMRQRRLSRLQQRVKETLGFADDIDPDQRLNEIGLDSPISVRLSSALEEEFGVSVPIADLITGPSINQLASSVFGDLIATSAKQQRSGIATWEPDSSGKSIIRVLANIEQPVPRPWSDRYNSDVMTSGTSCFSSLSTSGLRNGVARSEPVSGSRRARIELILQRHAMAELGFAGPIDTDRPLNELGLDSLRAVKLSIDLENELGIPVSASELISGPTINQLVDHLIDASAEHQADESEETALATTTSFANAVTAHELHDEVANPLEAEARVALEWYQGERDPRNVMSPRAAATTIESPGSRLDIHTRANGKADEAIPIAPGGNGGAAKSFDSLVLGRTNGVAVRTTGKWLIAPRPNPDAKCRLFCFPYAGGGLVSFRSWPELLDDSVEVVAIEPPGRGTRINESAVDDMDRFVDGLLPEMIDWVDRPSAFFGHCLGGLTMFATLRALPKTRMRFIRHAFACGVRPPHLLNFKGKFEDNLLYEMMLDRNFDVDLPPYAQADEIFANIIRCFNLPAADKMLETPRLREVLLPTIRAEFGMAHRYRYQPGEPFSFPISSFVGSSDPWVSGEDSAGWGAFTCGKFTNYLRDGSHFLMADDREYILQTIEREFVASASR